jgi:hypothetical protein
VAATPATAKIAIRHVPASARARLSFVFAGMPSFFLACITLKFRLLEQVYKGRPDYPF